MNWKTIDSAPRDGRDILVYEPEGREVAVVRMPQRGEYQAGRWTLSAYDAFSVTNPTHWCEITLPE